MSLAIAIASSMLLAVPDLGTCEARDRKHTPTVKACMGVCRPRATHALGMSKCGQLSALGLCSMLTDNPMRYIDCLKSSLSSARSMEGSLAPMSSTPYLSRIPFCG